MSSLLALPDQSQGYSRNSPESPCRCEELLHGVRFLRQQALVPRVRSSPDHARKLSLIYLAPRRVRHAPSWGASSSGLAPFGEPCEHPPISNHRPWSIPGNRVVVVKPARHVESDVTKYDPHAVTAGSRAGLAPASLTNSTSSFGTRMPPLPVGPNAPPQNRRAALPIPAPRQVQSRPSRLQVKRKLLFLWSGRQRTGMPLPTPVCYLPKALFSTPSLPLKASPYPKGFNSL